jgi:hypothetical protein
MTDDNAQLMLKPDNIGEVLTVQIFEKKGDGTIKTDTLLKYVGKLVSYRYVAKSRTVTIAIEGLPPVAVDLAGYHLEIFPRDIKRGIKER